MTKNFEKSTNKDYSKPAHANNVHRRAKQQQQQQKKDSQRNPQLKL